jgi:hypothetical protein
MKLSTKPDFDRAKDVWNHFWQGEVLKRPPVVVTVPKPGRKPVSAGSRRYFHAMTGQWNRQMELTDQWLDDTLFLAEAVPYFGPDHGPDQFAAVLGRETLSFSDDSPETNWIRPWVADGEWLKVLPLSLNENHPIWKSLLEYSRRLARHAKGRYLVGICDLHSNMDALLALRGGEGLSADFYDFPDRIEQAMVDVRKLYRPIYDALYHAAGMADQPGTIGWAPFWSPGRFATIQCDFLCLISPQFSRRFVLPALEEEASFLDHCVLHFDGPGALPHLDDVLGIKEIDVIQWVPGAGQRPMHEWLDILTHCQDKGKAVQIYGVNVDQVRELHKVLKPDKVVYCVDADTPEPVEDLLKWLERNT